MTGTFTQTLSCDLDSHCVTQGNTELFPSGIMGRKILIWKRSVTDLALLQSRAAHRLTLLRITEGPTESSLYIALGAASPLYNVYTCASDQSYYISMWSLTDIAPPPPSFCIAAYIADSSLFDRIYEINSESILFFSTPGTFCKARSARSADLFSSSCFSNSCFTELVFTLVLHVCFNGSISLSTSVNKNKDLWLLSKRA